MSGRILHISCFFRPRGVLLIRCRLWILQLGYGDVFAVSGMDCCVDSLGGNVMNIYYDL